jgi:hypothetical protein
MNQNKQLGAADDFDDADAFGLEEFGASRGGLSDLWGAVAATGLGTTTALGLRRFASGKLSEYSEALGFLAAAGASGAMIAMKGTRSAGYTGLAAAFLNNGLRALAHFMDPVMFKGYDGVVIDPTQAFAGYRGGGMGLVEVERTQALMGSEMPQLVGATLQSASDHVQLVGGPALSDIAHAWGHTHFSR